MRLADLDLSARATATTIVNDCAVEAADDGGTGTRGWHACEDILKRDLERLHGVVPDAELLAELKKKYVDHLEDAAGWSEFD